MALIVKGTGWNGRRKATRDKLMRGAHEIEKVLTQLSEILDLKGGVDQ